MSVYTEVPADALERFLRDYPLGTATACEGILDGVENTNYFLTVADDAVTHQFVLTLFESTPANALPFYLDLMAHLVTHGIPAPRPIAGHDGATLRSLCGKPAALLTRLPGRMIHRAEAAHCAAVGTILGRMHTAAATFEPSRDSTRGAAWRSTTLARLAARVGSADRALLAEEVAVQASTPLAGLPGGVVHGDLFRDNVLFDGPRLTGVIDFYYAAREAYVYDLAVAVADWCFDGDHCDAARARALLGGYRSIRPVTGEEVAAWPLALRAAGLRFWLSRLQDALYRKPGRMVQRKDPATCRAIVRAARREPGRLRACWD